MAGESLEKEAWHAARSQSVLRDVNEHIAQTPGQGAFIEFVCECSRRSCAERVALTIEEYELRTRCFD